jgi:hypothetical protein
MDEQRQRLKGQGLGALPNELQGSIGVGCSPFMPWARVQPALVDAGYRLSNSRNTVAFTPSRAGLSLDTPYRASCGPTRGFVVISSVGRAEN